MGCELCSGDSAETAWSSRSRRTEVRCLVDESHFRVTLFLCGACGQPHVSVFCETIDWQGGDDPQDWLVVPLSPGEAEALAAAGQDAEQAVQALSPRRHLLRSFPRDAAAPAVTWRDGPILLPRHD